MSPRPGLGPLCATIQDNPSLPMLYFVRKGSRTVQGVCPRRVSPLSYVTGWGIMGPYFLGRVCVTPSMQINADFLRVAVAVFPLAAIARPAGGPLLSPSKTLWRFEGHKKPVMMVATHPSYPLMVCWLPSCLPILHSTGGL